MVAAGRVPVKGVQCVRWASVGPADWRSRIQQFYLKHNPSKLEGAGNKLPDSVLDVLAKHEGNEERVWKALLTKYGVEEAEAMRYGMEEVEADLKGAGEEVAAESVAEQGAAEVEAGLAKERAAEDGAAEEEVRKYEAEVTVAAKAGDHVALLRLVKQRNEAGVLPTGRVYQVLLSMYYEESRRAKDAELNRELAEVTFSKARARGCASPAMWTLMMMVHASSRNARKARELDRLRDANSIPVPQGDGYCAALRTALSSEKRGAFGPPAALLHDKEYLLAQQELARQLQREPD